MLFILSASLFACTSSSGGDSGFPVPGGNDDPDDPSRDSSLYFQPELIGFEMVSGWDEYRDSLIDYSFNGSVYEPQLRVILANRSYLDPRDTGFQEPENVCELVTSLNVQPADLDVELIEPTAGEVAAPLRGSYVGSLTVFGYDGGACQDFDPAVWDNGEPKFAFDGMRIGVGLGEMTDFLESQWQTQTLMEYGRYMLASYFAFNQLDENGDLEFVARDRTTSLVWQLDPDAELIVTTDVAPLGQDINEPWLYAYLSGYAWYFESLEDIPIDRLSEVVD
ncbi:MAG: hypothetical protein AAFV53_07190 [Myxococcota bacterium]